jgi:pimeloyl-ACP methyl ester carboxylesterase
MTLAAAMSASSKPACIVVNIQIDGKSRKSYRLSISWGGLKMKKIHLLIILLLSCIWAMSALAQEGDDLDTLLPPPELETKAASGQSTVDNGDGTFTFTQTINAGSTPPHYVAPGGYGFSIYSWYNEDYGWQHNFPEWNVEDLNILSAELIITAWDVDSETFHGESGEYDGIYVDGVMLDPGYLQGTDDTWSVTEFNVQRSDIVDDGLINVWMDIDMHHDYRRWATTLDNCRLVVVYSTNEENVPPYRPELVITPGCPSDNENLVVDVVGPAQPDPNGDNVTYLYEWFVDVGTGEYIEDAFAGRGEHNSNIVPASDTVVGDLWRVQVRARDDYGHTGDYTTETWPNPIGCMPPEVEIVDATPYLLGNIPVVGFTLTDFDRLSSIGVPRTQTRVDGNSRLLIRYTSSYSGIVSVELTDPVYGGQLGTINRLNSTQVGTTATSEMLVTSRGRQAFFVYTPPKLMWNGPPYHAATKTIHVDMTLNTDTGQTYTESATIILHPRQILYVHGIWGKADNWSRSHFDYSNFGIDCYTIDYEETSPQGVNANYGILESSYNHLMSSSRAQGVCATQIDIVAHSMGGLLTRRWAAEPDFENLNNFRNGKVNRLVTIDTPHFGSAFANQYVALAQAFVEDPGYDCFVTINAIKTFGVGVLDLRRFSPTICGLGETDIPTHVIVGEGGEDHYSDADDFAYKFIGMIDGTCGLEPTALFPNQEHDFIVGSDSQYGGILQANSHLNPTGLAGEHSGALKTLTVGMQVLNSVLGDGETGFASSIPAPSSFGGCGPIAAAPENVHTLTRMTETKAGCISILSPSSGSQVIAGSQLPLTLQGGGAEIEQAMFIMIDGFSEYVGFVDDVGSVLIPEMDPGVYTSLILVRTVDGDICVSDKIELIVPANGTAESLDILNDTLLLHSPGWSGRFVVRAQLSDGTEFNLSDPRTGVEYTSMDPTVAAVEPDGAIMAIGPGETDVNIQFSGLSVTGRVQVMHAVANDRPTAVLTPEQAAVCVGDTLALDGSESYDIDSLPTQPLMFEWDIDGDGEFNDATGPVLNLYARDVGNFMIGMRVRDAAGAIDEASAAIIVTDCGPVIEDVNPDVPGVGQIIEIRGLLFAADPGAGNHSTPQYNVTLNGEMIPESSFVSWADRLIELSIPAGAQDGDLIVTSNGLASNGHPINIQRLTDCLWAYAVEPDTTAIDSRAVAWGDYDNDGDQDLFVTNDGPNQLFENIDGDLVLSPETPAEDADSRGAAWGDYDNDHDLDLYVVNDASANKLYRNDGGVFVDVTVGPEGDDGAGYNASWADVDGDNDLDLYICNEGGTSKLLINDDDLFVHQPGVTDVSGITRASAFCDFDKDGDQDLYLSRYGANMLLVNEGKGTFIDMTTAPLDNDAGGKGVAWGDYDNDGDMDLYLVNSNAENHLFRNDGQLGFYDVMDPVIADAGVGRSCAWADWNNDGWLDLFVSNAVGPNRMLQNIGGAFADSLCGSVETYKNLQTWGCSFADVNGDGDQDLYTAIYRSEEANKLHVNDLMMPVGGNWLQINLTGVESNSFGIGARITVDTGDKLVTREVSAGSSYLSQGPLTASFGLGEAAMVDVIINWPSGIMQAVTDVTANAVLNVEEMAGSSSVNDHQVPERFFASNYPNPFNPKTTIVFGLPKAAIVNLQIFDLRGSLVKTIYADQAIGAGRHQVEWIGRDEDGKQVSSGVYFYRLRAGKDTAIERMTLLK